VIPVRIRGEQFRRRMIEPSSRSFAPEHVAPRNSHPISRFIDNRYRAGLSCAGEIKADERVRLPARVSVEQNDEIGAGSSPSAEHDEAYEANGGECGRVGKGGRFKRADPITAVRLVAGLGRCRGASDSRAGESCEAEC